MSTYFDVAEVADKVVLSSLESGYEAAEPDSLTWVIEGVKVHSITAVVNAVKEADRIEETIGCKVDVCNPEWLIRPSN